jgi:hypothetical protein
MPERWLGVVVSGDGLVAVDAEVPDAGPLVIQADHSWSLQAGNRAAAYAVMHQQVANYVKERKIARVVIKASALSQGSTKLAHLQAAELRGVVITASASVGGVTTNTLAKATVSRGFGKRKVDEYVKDNDFWADSIQGAKLRIGSREAAMLLIASRKK